MQYYWKATTKDGMTRIYVDREKLKADVFAGEVIAYRVKEIPMMQFVRKD